MCGIVGAVAQRNIVPTLVEGLRRLEYRGYDSAGISVLHGDRIDAVRAVGNLSALREMAMRHTAHEVEERLSPQLVARHGGGPAERILICLTGRPSSAMLIRRARRVRLQHLGLGRDAHHRQQDGAGTGLVHARVFEHFVEVDVEQPGGVLMGGAVCAPAPGHRLSAGPARSPSQSPTST